MTFVYKETYNGKKVFTFDFSPHLPSKGEIGIAVADPFTAVRAAEALNSYCVSMGYAIPTITDAMVTL